LRKQKCSGLLTLDYRLDDGSELIRVGEWAKRNSLHADTYGEGAFAQAFEREVADLLGFEAACFMPTGTMAQLCALRIFADRSPSRSRTIGVHPSSHHLLHEDDAYSALHNLKATVIAPWERPIQAADIQAAPEVVAISIEMPVRWIGGQLPSWEELVAIKAAAAARQCPLMMDGARLWETQPFYGRSYADICHGFDAVYVSFYKMIGASNGAMLVGSKDFIEQARKWRHRQGGDDFQHFAAMASSAMRLRAVLPRLAGYRDRAVSFASRLAQDKRFVVMPSPPQTNLFRVFLPGKPDDLIARRDKMADDHGVWVGDFFRASRVPGLSQVELQIGPGFDTLDDRAAVAAFTRLLTPA
jgi:threonine aldolase